MFVKFMENKGYDWHSFDYCYEMEGLIEEYADMKLKDIAYALLGEVRAFLHKNSMLPESYFVDEIVISVEKLDNFLLKYISENFS